MIKTPLFKGSCTAVATPFTQEGIDYSALSRNLDRQYENGTAAIVVAGTTGENAALTANEYTELVRFTVQHCKNRMKVIVGIGHNNTAVALKNAEDAYFTGADGILMVTPYYNKSTQRGIYEHFTYVADRVELPMLLYNVPSRTGIGITVETYKRLSSHPNIVGVKEASGNLSLAAQITAACGDELYLYSGNDDNTVPMMALGALGVISVASNIVPGVVSKLCELCLSGDFTAATELYSKYAELFSTLFIETNPIPLKAAMKLMDTDSGILRLPLVEISEENLVKLRAAMRNAGINI